MKTILKILVFGLVCATLWWLYYQGPVVNRNAQIAVHAATAAQRADLTPEQMEFGAEVEKWAVIARFKTGWTAMGEGFRAAGQGLRLMGLARLLETRLARALAALLLLLLYSGVLWILYVQERKGAFWLWLYFGGIGVGLLCIGLFLAPA